MKLICEEKENKVKYLAVNNVDIFLKMNTS